MGCLCSELMITAGEFLVPSRKEGTFFSSFFHQHSPQAWLITNQRTELVDQLPSTYHALLVTDLTRFELLSVRRLSTCGQCRWCCWSVGPTTAQLPAVQSTTSTTAQHPAAVTQKMDCFWWGLSFTNQVCWRACIFLFFYFKGQGMRLWYNLQVLGEEKDGTLGLFQVYAHWPHRQPDDRDGRIFLRLDHLWLPDVWDRHW